MNDYPILIIDDNEGDRYILKRLLKGTGLTSSINEMNNGQSAIDYLSKLNSGESATDDFPPTIIFLDINMPLLDGFQFLNHYHELKLDESFSSTIIMMFSSSGREEDKRKAFLHDCVKGYIVKMPESSDELKLTISNSLAGTNRKA
ncbi:MAG: response regulator [Lentisphaeria bacterium]|nr:response regulator [Lentisphaeria bacterium]